MEIIASDLKEVLARLLNILTNKGLVENANKFIFSGDKIHVFDGQTFIQVNFKTEIFGSVEGDSFFKYIEKMGTAKIEMTQTEDKVNVKRGKSVASFVTEKDEDCPIVIDGVEWKKAPENFLAGLNACSYTCGEDYTDMRSVVIHVKNNFVESTDGERITRFTLSSKVRGELFIPKDLVSFLTKGKIVSYAQTEEWMFFKNQNSDLICHRCISLAEEYEDLGKVVEGCNEGEKLELPEKMYDSIEKAAIFQNDVKVESDKRITIRCKGEKLRIESNGSHGNFLEIINSNIQRNFAFSINPNFLMQIMEKSNQILFHEDYIRIEAEEYVFLTCLAGE